MSHPTLSESEFITFLLIYAAHVDYVYSDEEAYLIKALARGNEYDLMYKLFMSMSDYQSLKIILKNKEKYFKEIQSRKKLYNIIIELFKVDGAYTLPEKTFLKFLDKLTETKEYGSQS